MVDTKSWYLMTGNHYFSGHETDQFNKLSPTAFSDYLSVSPEAYDVTVDGVSKRVILQHTDESNKRILLSHIGDVQYGSVVGYDNRDWLVIENPTNDKINDHTDIQLCNTHFTFYGQPTKVKVGTEPSGLPIYEETPGQQYSYPCIIKSANESYDGSTEQINIPDGKLTLIISNVKNDELDIDVEFDWFGEKYKVFGFDYSKTLGDKGLLYVIADKI